MKLVGTPKLKMTGRPKGSVSQSGKMTPLRIAKTNRRLSQTKDKSNAQ